MATVKDRDDRRAKGLDRIDFWLPQELKQKAAQYCEQNSMTQTKLMTRLLTDRLSDFNPTPSGT